MITTTISAISKTNKRTNHQRIPIYIRITRKKKHAYINTGIKIPIIHWDNYLKIVKIENPNNVEHNYLIQLMYNDILKIISNFDAISIPYSAKDIKNYYITRNSNDFGFNVLKIGSESRFVFTKLISRIKNRAKDSGKSFNLTFDYLLKLYNLQKGRCKLSNITMNVGKLGCPENLSIDRINSSVGYIQGNVQLVCVGINYMKNSYSNEAAKDFINKIRNPYIN